MKILAPNKGENKQNQHNDFEMKKIRTTHELLKAKKNEEPKFFNSQIRPSFFTPFTFIVLCFLFLFNLLIFLFSKDCLTEVNVNLTIFLFFYSKSNVSHFGGLDFLNEIQAVNWIFSSP